MQRDSIGHTFKVAVLLCLVCSLFVSAAAVSLRDRQQANRSAEMKLNVLKAAGLWKTGVNVDDLFDANIEQKLVDLETGDYSDAFDVEKFNPRKAAKDPKLSIKIEREDDLAEIKRRENYALVYLVKNDDGSLDQVVLPIRGYGLWSTLWGFIALDAATLGEGPAQTKVRGITFYEHKETPGLGGEVDNPKWKAKWKENKLVFDEDWNVIIETVRGTVSSSDPHKDHKVDGLSGATFTTAGVQNMLHFWLGDKAFGPYLKKLHAELKAKGGQGG